MARYSRLKKIEQLLVQRRFGIEKRRLARLLRVSVRTIERDLAELRRSGVPLVSTESEKAGVARLWRIDREQYPGIAPREQPPLGTDLLENFALAAALECAELPHSQWLDDARQTVYEKVAVYAHGRSLGELPVIRAGLAAVGPDMARVEEIPRAVVERFLECAVHCRTVRATYPWGGGRARAKLIEPLGVVIAHGGLYGVVRIPPHDDIRCLSLSRVVRASATDEAFDPPAGFSLSAWAKTGFQLFHERPRTVRIRFDAEVADAIRSRRIHESQRTRSLPGGGLILTLKTSGKEEILWWLLRWGAHAELLAPRAWRQDMAQTARAMALLYGLRKQHCNMTD